MRDTEFSTVIYYDDVVQARYSGVEAVPRTGDSIVMTIRGVETPGKVEDVVWRIIPRTYVEVSVYVRIYKNRRKV